MLQISAILWCELIKVALSENCHTNTRDFRAPLNITKHQLLLYHRPLTLEHEQIGCSPYMYLFPPQQRRVVAQGASTRAVEGT